MKPFQTKREIKRRETSQQFDIFSKEWMKYSSDVSSRSTSITNVHNMASKAGPLAMFSTTGDACHIHTHWSL